MKNILLLAFTFSVVKIGNCQIVYPEEEGYCREKIKDTYCVHIAECPTAKDDIKRGRLPVTCGFSGDVPLVCCLASDVSTDPETTSDTFCGRNVHSRSNEDIVYRNDSYEEEQEPDGANINTDGSFIIQPRILSREKFHVSSQEWPWMVAVYLKSNGSFVCNGFLIDSSHLLTAAHCFNGRRKEPHFYYVGLIENEGKTSTEVTELRIHPNYREEYYYYSDIAVLTISPSAGNAIPICMPSGVNDTDYLGMETIVLDWLGTDYATQKNQVEETRVCDRFYTSLSNSPFRDGVTDDMLCATPKEARDNACQIHSGGPVMVEESGIWEAVAIATFGIPCTLPNYPAVYTKISPYLEWIRSKP